MQRAPRAYVLTGRASENGEPGARSVGFRSEPVSWSAGRQSNASRGQMASFLKDLKRPPRISGGSCGTRFHISLSSLGTTTAGQTQQSPEVFPTDHHRVRSPTLPAPGEPPAGVREVQRGAAGGLGPVLPGHLGQGRGALTGPGQGQGRGRPPARGPGGQMRWAEPCPSPPGPASPRSQPVPLRRAAAAPIGSPRPVHLHTARPLAEPLPRLRFTCAAELAALGAPAAGCPPPARLGSARLGAAQPSPAPPASRPGPKSWRCPPRLHRVNRLQPSAARTRRTEDNNPEPCVCARPAVLHCNACSGEAPEPPWNRDKKKKNPPFTWGLWLFFLLLVLLFFRAQ
nr:keratinocyte proline-rich protein-like [Anser cygnoides]